MKRKIIKRITAIECERCGSNEHQLYEIRTNDPTVWDELCDSCIVKEADRWKRAVDSLRRYKSEGVGAGPKRDPGGLSR